MSRPMVKICGITRVEDAQLAVDLGANALGFIFWTGSPRKVSVERASAITRALPRHVIRVGVFVDAPVDEIQRAVTMAGLTAVQLHGNEDPAEYQTLPAQLIKAVTADSDDSIERAERLPAAVTPLVDATDREQRGGTGKVADWRRAARLAGARHIILAGGLTADNVADAVAAVKPWGVDVSSGVEEAPGVKSRERLERFFAALAATC